jgi:hypothetical protein
MRHNIKKATGCANIQKAKFQKPQSHSTLITRHVKAEFIKLAVCVSIAWGA